MLQTKNYDTFNFGANYSSIQLVVPGVINCIYSKNQQNNVVSLCICLEMSVFHMPIIVLFWPTYPLLAERFEDPPFTRHGERRSHLGGDHIHCPRVRCQCMCWVSWYHPPMAVFLVRAYQWVGATIFLEWKSVKPSRFVEA